MHELLIKDLHVKVEDKEILKGVNLTLKTGEIHAIMGPNGTGKSTLAAVIMGNPNYKITQGEILFDGVAVNELEVDERARLGLFLAMQYPAEIPGITNTGFIKEALKAQLPPGEKLSLRAFLQELDETMEFLQMPIEMADRYLNEGFSGGEKKRNEILQMMMLKPAFAILDEIDSGLDIDALKIVANGVNEMRNGDFGALIITHYQRLLDYIVPDYVHIMKDGQIIKTGGATLALQLEAQGYNDLLAE